MKLLAIPLTIAAAILAIALAGPLQERWQDANAYQRQQEAIALERQSFNLRQYQQQQTAIQPGIIASDYVWRLLTVLAGAGLLYLVTDMYRARQRRVDDDRRLVYPNAAGYLPAPRIALERGELVDLLADAIRAAGIARIEEARRAIPPHSLTYAPKFSSTTNESEDAPELTAPIVVPTVAELLASGQIGRGRDGRRQPLIMGYSSAGAVSGDWRSLYSTGIGGLQGSGKTWGASFLLMQSALNGGRLVICDPHSSDIESLATRLAPLASAFLCDVAESDSDILAALGLAADLLDQRKHGDPTREPIIIAIDEYLSLRRGKLADVLPGYIEAFSTEGRKLNIHCMLLTQRADKEAIGAFRNTLASNYIFRFRPDEVRMLTGLRASALPDDTLQLGPGECYLLDTHGQLTRIKIPLMTGDDMTTAGRLLTDSQPTIDQGVSHRSAIDQPSFSHSAAHDYAAVGRATTLTPEAARVLSLFRAGEDASAIVQALYGLSSKGGKPYMTKLAEVQAIIRAALLERAA